MALAQLSVISRAESQRRLTRKPLDIPDPTSFLTKSLKLTQDFGALPTHALKTFKDVNGKISLPAQLLLKPSLLHQEPLYPLGWEAPVCTTTFGLL